MRDRGLETDSAQAGGLDRNSRESIQGDIKFLAELEERFKNAIAGDYGDRYLVREMLGHWREELERLIQQQPHNSQ